MKTACKKTVALKYPAGADAPFITASAKGILAEKMVEIAEKEHIPVVKNSELTDVLTLSEVGSCVPENTWIVLAEIFAFVIRNSEGKEIK